MPRFLKHILSFFHSKQIGILLCLLCTFTSVAQTFTEYETAGDEATTAGLYKTALQQYDIALQFEKNNSRIIYKAAEAARLYNNYAEAIQRYESIIELNAERHYVDLYYHLAEMYKNTGDFVSARTYFEKYLDSENPVANLKFADKAKTQLLACSWALQNNNPIDSVKVTHLSNKINTKNSESAAVLMGDSLLLFSSLREFSVSKFNDDIIPDIVLSQIYESKKDKKNYTIATVNKWKFNKGNKHTANPCFDKINNRMYFTRCDDDNLKDPKCKIYFSDLKSGKWSKPKPLGDEINLPEYTATQPAVEIIDGKTILYFVSDRPHGSGGLDIWYSIIENGKTQKAINLGYPINTNGNEVTPFYHQESGTLYFSSDYHSGYGGYDIFSSKGSLNQWGMPVNLGMPINSSANDLYYTVNNDSLSGYLTSNRVGSFFIDNNTCCNDIYEWKIQPSKKQTPKKQDSLLTKKDTVTSGNKIFVDKLMPIKLYFHNDEPDPKTQKLTTEKVYSDLLSNYQKLEETYVKNYTKGLSKDSTIAAQDEMKRFFEQDLQGNYRHFKEFIIYLLNDLKAGKQIHLIVRGYASPLYTSSYNKNLSKRRISSIINELLNYDNGAIAQYINHEDTNTASLEVIELALGSSTANTSISNNANDLRNSIYSIAAAKERRIEILSYTYNDIVKNELPQNNSQLILGKELFSLGKVSKKEKVQLEIPVFNSSKIKQEIELVEIGCSCIKARYKEEIPAKENGFILLDIDVSKQAAGSYISPLTIKLRSESFSQTIFIEYKAY